MKARRYMQVCVDAINGADGQGLISIIRQVLSAHSADWAVLSDVDLVGNARQYLLTQGHDVRVMSVSRLLKLLREAEQVVWATIFLCGTKEAAETITGSEDFILALEKSKLLVRVVDATYYYIYGPVEYLENLSGKMEGEQKEGFAEELDFPE
jgi:hypothetical protein